MTALNQPLDGLIERVAGATGPDREIDAHIRVALEPPADDEFVTDCPFYTSSIDAAVAFCVRMLPTTSWGVDKTDEGDAAVWFDAIVGEGFAQHCSPALAIILATLRAIQHSKTGDAA